MTQYDPDKLYNVVDADGNPLGSTKGKYFNNGDAQRAGWRVETPEEKIENDYAEEHGTGTALIKGFTTEFTGEPTDRTEALQLEGLKKNNPAAFKVGQVSSVLPGVALAAATGGAGLLEEGALLGGEEATAGLGTRILTGAARGAIETAIAQSPQSIAQATLQNNPQKAAETMLTALVAGGVLGGATGALSKPVSNAINNIKINTTLKSIGEGTSTENNDIIKAMIKDNFPEATAKQDFVNALHENGLNRQIGENFEQWQSRIAQSKADLEKTIDPRDLYNRPDYRLMDSLSTIKPWQTASETGNKLGGFSTLTSAAEIMHHGLGAGLALGAGFKVLKKAGHVILEKNAPMLVAKGLEALQNTPQILKSMAAQTVLSPLRYETNKIEEKPYQALQDNTGKKDPQQAYQAFADQIPASLLTTPENIQQSLHQINQTHPTAAQALQQHYNNTITYLAKAAPPPPPAAPFQPPPPVPTKQIKSLNDKLDIIQHPLNVFKYANNGTLNEDHVDALNNVYPEIKKDLVQSINDYGLKHPDMPYQKKLLLSLLVGSPLDNSLMHIKELQQIYQVKQENPQPMAAGKLKKLPGTEYSQLDRIRQ